MRRGFIAVSTSLHYIYKPHTLVLHLGGTALTFVIILQPKFKTTSECLDTVYKLDFEYDTLFVIQQKLELFGHKCRRVHVTTLFSLLSSSYCFFTPLFFDFFVIRLAKNRCWYSDFGLGKSN